jgi:hypothetical protein
MDFVIVKTICFSFYFYCIENYQYKVVLTDTNNATKDFITLSSSNQCIEGCKL